MTCIDQHQLNINKATVKHGPLPRGQVGKGVVYVRKRGIAFLVLYFLGVDVNGNSAKVLRKTKHAMRA